jgi:Tfp pilus assembly protein PilE
MNKIRQLRSPRKARPFPRGVLLLELVICGIILGVVVSAVIPTLVWLASERQHGRQQQAALLEVGNLMERLTMLDWDDLTAQRAAERAENLRNVFPEAQLKVTVAAADTDSKAKHIVIELRWEFARGRPAPPVRLAAWVYQQDK